MRVRAGNAEQIEAQKHRVAARERRRFAEATGALALPTVVAWNADLMRLHRGEMGYDAFLKRHAGIIRSISGKWGNRCPERLGADDAFQEASLALWHAFEAWDETRGTPLNEFVRIRVKFRLLALTNHLLKGRDVETHFFYTRDHNAPEVPLVDSQVSAQRRYAGVVGGMEDPPAADVVMYAMSGLRVDDIAQEIYPNRTPGGAKKKARSVLRDASQLATQF